MSYTDAIAQLNALAPELFTQPGRPRRKFSLDEFRTLLDALGNPHHKFPSVLIAGTNGKGSTAATLASILQAAGLRTGLYTSPHLERPNERIRVGREEIEDGAFGRYFAAVQYAQEALLASGALPQPASFFEVLTAMAFLAFAEAGVDIAVLEVGLGGRLDATNVVEPLVSVITDISLDHTEWLGSTISAIAHEKAGILRPNGVLVTLPQHPQANQAIGEVATQLNVRGVSATPYTPPIHTAAGHAYRLGVMGQEIEISSPLSGEHQYRNVALAIATAVELASDTPSKFAITPEAIALGIRNTRWPGRLELLTAKIGSSASQWLLDVAHNPAGVWALRAALSQLFGGEAAGGSATGAEGAVGPTAGGAVGAPQVLVFGCLKDKPLIEMAQVLFPLFRQIVFAPIASPRATPMEELIRAAEMTGTPAVAAPSVKAALETAVEFAAGRPIVVSGSVYLVGAARSILLHRGQA